MELDSLSRIFFNTKTSVAGRNFYMQAKVVLHFVVRGFSFLPVFVACSTYVVKLYYSSLFTFFFTFYLVRLEFGSPKHGII